MKDKEIKKCLFVGLKEGRQVATNIWRLAEAELVVAMKCREL